MRCSTSLCSSVHTDDAALAEFFVSAEKAVASVDELRTRRACHQLAAVAPARLTAHFVPVIDHLLRLIAHNLAAASAFVALVDVLSRVDVHTRVSGKTTQRNPLLDAYLYYLFDGCVLTSFGRFTLTITLQAGRNQALWQSN